jgi:hypothetical protein
LDAALQAGVPEAAILEAGTMPITRRWLLGAPALLRPAVAAQVPRPAGEFEYFLPGGKPALITAHKGKLVVLEFLFTT